LEKVPDDFSSSYHGKGPAGFFGLVLKNQTSPLPAPKKFAWTSPLFLPLGCYLTLGYSNPSFVVKVSIWKGIAVSGAPSSHPSIFLPLLPTRLCFFFSTILNCFHYLK
jgi:hypothetical protein